MVVILGSVVIIALITAIIYAIFHKKKRNFRFVEFSHSTARRNPQMILREYNILLARKHQELLFFDVKINDQLKAKVDYHRQTPFNIEFLECADERGPHQRPMTIKDLQLLYEQYTGRLKQFQACRIEYEELLNEYNQFTDKYN